MSLPDDVSLGGRDGLGVEFHHDGYVAFTINGNEHEQSVYTNDKEEIRKLHAALGRWLAEQEGERC